MKTDHQDPILARFQLSFPDFTLETDLQLPARGVTVLFGPSGCGKTTLLRCIAGLERASQGLLQVRETVWQDSERRYFLPPYQRPVGYVFQEPSLFEHLSVRGNLEFGQKRIPARERRIALEQALELLGIEHLLERMPQHLSGGEKQRVAIARALAVSPQLLLMDEPLAALDLPRRQEILPFLARLHQELEIPMLYVTHSPQEVTRLGDHLVMLEQGRVVASGDLQETLTRLDLPVAQSRQASTVLSVTVCGHETAYGLTEACFNGGRMLLPLREAIDTGTVLRLRIYARDVSLTLQQPQQTSILNVLPATITRTVAGEEGQTIVQLSLGGTRLLAHVTRKSADVLGLQPGLPVFAQIKVTAIL